MSHTPEALAAEYRKTMTNDVLHSWAADAATTLRTLSAELAAARSEVNDQARLNGMGAERELALIAERDSLRAEVERLRKDLENTQAEAVLGMAVAARLSAPPPHHRGGEVIPTREQVIQWAEEASDKDKVPAFSGGFWTLTQDELERFAAIGMKEHP
jgi:hypothetical protein